MDMPVNIQIDEFLNLAGHISLDEAERAEKIFHNFMVGRKKDRWNMSWGLAALYMAGYISGVRNERARRDALAGLAAAQKGGVQA